MKIAIIAAGLALAGGLGAAAPAEAQYDVHDNGYHGQHRGDGYRDRDDGYRDRGEGYRGDYGYRHRGYGPGYGYGGGYRRGRVICTYRHGYRRCFRR